MGLRMLQGSTAKSAALPARRHGYGAPCWQCWKVRGNRRMQYTVMMVTPLLMLAGCAVPGTLQKLAIDQNRVVARTADSQTLRNIVRAKRSRPLHFTSIARISGNIDLTATAELAARQSAQGRHDRADRHRSAGHSLKQPAATLRRHPRANGGDEVCLAHAVSPKPALQNRHEGKQDLPRQSELHR